MINEFIEMELVEGVWQEKPLFSKLSTSPDIQISVHFVDGVSIRKCLESLFVVDVKSICGQEYRYNCFDFPRENKLCNCGNLKCFVVYYGQVKE